MKHVTIGGGVALGSTIADISLFDDKGRELKVKKGGQLQDVTKQMKDAGKGKITNDNTIEW